MAEQQPTPKRFFSYDTAALALRIVLGLIFIYHGGQKTFAWFNLDDLPAWLQWLASPHKSEGFEASVNGFVAMGIPRPLAMAVPITELVGGLCLIAGLLSRFWAAGLAVIMLSAIVMIHAKQGWANNEFQLALLAMAVTIFLAGPGRWAVGDLEGRLLGLGREE
jgi:putative oxidoreductase